MPPENKDLLKELLTALQARADSEQGTDLGAKLDRVGDQLEKLNAGMGGDREAREKDEEIRRLAKDFPAIKSRFPRLFSQL
jgi:hypothetical protein